MKLMQHHHHADISDSFHCKRSHSGEVVHVYNSNNYLMAEYTIRTGRTSWQRVAALTQRESVEKWLRNNYPAVIEVSAAAPPKAAAPKATAAKAVAAKAVVEKPKPKAKAARH